MITKESAEYKNCIEKCDKLEYSIIPGNIPKGESIQCQDDEDMVIKLDENGEVCLIKKSYSKEPFQR